MESDQMATGLFLIAHDEFTGKLRISPDLLGCGLVGAQLAELVMAGRLAVEDNRVVPAGARGSGQDEIGAFVVDSVQRQPARHTVRAWTETFAPVLHELVSRRLVDLGVVRREQGRGVLRRRTDRFPAVDLLKAARPRVRLEAMLRNPRELDLKGGFTAALVWTLGIDAVLDPDIDRAAARDLVGHIVDNLPTDLRALLNGTQAAVAAVSLTVRR